MQKIWENKLKEAALSYQLAKNELKLAELEAKEKKNIKGIESWLGYTFESSSCLTPEYAQFSREIKSYIKKQLGEDLELINWNKGHFYFSGFIKNKLTKRLVYASCSDVRFWKDGWYNNLLIRTAESEKDYTGGSNNHCSLKGLKDKALKLTE